MCPNSIGQRQHGQQNHLTLFLNERNILGKLEDFNNPLWKIILALFQKKVKA